jgi:drug/metabolite transporter (DMT)-like permease
LAHLVGLLAVLIWSASFLAAARLRQELSVTEALAARFVPVFLGAAALLLWRRPRFPRGAWPRIVALGLCGVVLYNTFFFLGLGRVPSGTAALIIALNPVFTAVGARMLLGETFGPRRAAGLTFALGGVYVVVRYGAGREVDWPYLSAAAVLVLAPVVWSAYSILGRGLPAGTGALDATLALLLVGSAPLLILVNRHAVEVLATSPAVLWAALYLAVPCTLVGFTAWLWALKRLPAAEVAALLFLTPLLANLWSWLFEGMRLHLAFVAGGVLLLVGVGLVVIRREWVLPT